MRETNMPCRRVVVTGLGLVTSIGIGKKAFWKALLSGTSGISEIETFETTEYAGHRGGEVKGFVPTDFVSARLLKSMARASQFAVAATNLALEDAGIPLESLKGSRRAGAIMGTTMADIQSLEEINKYWTRSGEDDVWPINIIKYPSHELSNHIGYYLGLEGPNCVLPTACAAGNYSIGYAYDLIARGKADIMFAGGADPISRITFTGFSRLFAMAPEKCQPFDRNRKGMMVGEGGAILVLEEREAALTRGARVYAEIGGYGLSCDALHMTAPRLESVIKVMRKALANSGLKTTDVDYVSAHGTGTPMNDKVECQALKTLFGDHVTKVSVSSIKSMLGHTMGAASAIEAAACCLAVHDDVVPPTMNHENEDPECDIDCVPNRSRKRIVRAALNNSFAFGGNNASVAFVKHGK